MNDKLKELLSVFTVYTHNFRILHWNCRGKCFDTMHGIAKGLYEMTSDDIDIVAEMIMRSDNYPVSYAEAIGILREAEANYNIFPSDETYEWDDFVESTNTLLVHIGSAIISTLESEEFGDMMNVGIKSSLEAMYERYDLQQRFLNKARKD